MDRKRDLLQNETASHSGRAFKEEEMKIVRFAMVASAMAVFASACVMDSQDESFVEPIESPENSPENHIPEGSGPCTPPGQGHCQSGLTCCVTGGPWGTTKCRNLQNDENNCGGCNVFCGGTCVNGQCMPN